MTSEEENEIIRSKLLNLKRFDSDRCVTERGFLIPMPHFTDWQSAGLILDDFSKRRTILVLSHIKIKGWRVFLDECGIVSAGQTGPLAIRQAALDFMHGFPDLPSRQ